MSSGVSPSVLGNHGKHADNESRKERETYAPPTALYIKIFGWNAIKREMEIPVLRT